MVDRYPELLRKLLAGEVEKAFEEELYELLKKQRCLYLLSLYPSSSQKRQEIDNLLQTNKAVICIMMEHFRAVAETLNKTGINYAVIKGIPVSMKAYGDYFYKASYDTDILVDKKDAGAIKKILNKNGYVQGKFQNGEVIPISRGTELFYLQNAHQMAAFIKPTGDSLYEYVSVDVNICVWEKEDILGMTKSFIDNCEIQCIYPGLKVKALSIETCIIQIALNLYRDMNNLYLMTKKNSCLSKFCDLYFLVKHNLEKIDSDKFSYICNFYRINSIIFCIMKQCTLIFGDDVFGKLMSPIECMEGKQLVNMYGLQKRKKWPVSWQRRIFSEDLFQYIKDDLDDDDIMSLKANKKYD